MQLQILILDKLLQLLITLIAKKLYLISRIYLTPFS